MAGFVQWISSKQDRGSCSVSPQVVWGTASYRPCTTRFPHPCWYGFGEQTRAWNSDLASGTIRGPGHCNSNFSLFGKQ